MSNNVIFQRGDEDGNSDVWDDTALIKAYDNAISAMKTKLAAKHPEFSITTNSSAKKKKKNKSKAAKKRSSNGRTPKSNHGWKVGDFCQAVFTEDGEVYSAKILSIEDDGTCTVKYLGYGNEEEQLLDSLLPAASDASSQEFKTDTASEGDSICETQEDRQTSSRRKSQRGPSGSSSKSNVPPWSWNNFAVPPPPPPISPHPHQYPAFSHQPRFATATPGYGAPPPFAPMFPGVPPPPPMFSNAGSDNENEALYSMLISWYMSGYHTGYYQGLKNAKSSSLMGGPHR